MIQAVREYSVRPFVATSAGGGGGQQRGFTLPLEPEAKVLSVHSRGGFVTVLALGEKRDVSGAVKREFRVYGTGEPIEPVPGKRLDYVGTFFTERTGQAWHVFELRPY